MPRMDPKRTLAGSRLVRIDLRNSWITSNGKPAPTDLQLIRLGGQRAGSNKGHTSLNVQYSWVVVGCHLRRKVFEFAISHDPHKPKVNR